MKIIFFLSLGIILYTYFGYFLLLAILSTFLPQPVKKRDYSPMVTVFLSATEEEKDIEARVNDLLETDYPRDRLEIFVGSDGSTDETYRIIQKLAAEKNIRYAVAFMRLGKTEMINKMAKDAKGDIYIFAEARQRFGRTTVKELVRCFGDEEVGAVSGELVIEEKGAGVDRGMRLYRAYEKKLGKMESAIGSMLGVPGAIYAIRRECFRYLPRVILEDVYTPMNAILLGKRVVFETAAKTYDTVSATAEKKFIRKVHVLIGNFQIFSMFSEAFNPFKSKVAFQLFSHKFLRLMVPYVLLVLFVSNGFLMKKGPFFVWTHFTQVGFYFVAFLGYLIEKTRVSLPGILRILYIPYEFCVLHFAAVVALKLSLAGETNIIEG